MAEAVGLISGVLTLAVFAFQSSVTLCNTVKSFQFHQQRVRDLTEELDALSQVLHSLSETINGMPAFDFTPLKRPLLQCGNACTEFKKQIAKCSAHSSGGRPSFRDWARLTYMGEDIDGFRHMLVAYRLTVNIALTDATL